MSLNEEINGFYFLNNPIEPTKDRFGDSNISEYIKNRGDKYGMLLNNNYLRHLQARCYTSYQNGLPSPTMLHIKDLYYGFIISLLVRNAQSYTEDQTELNQAGRLFNEFRKSYTPPSNRKGGLLGSLSWWIKEISYQELTVFELTEQILNTFWTYLGINLELSTYQKYLELIKISDINNLPIEYYNDVLSTIINGEESELIEYTKILRQNFITTENLSDFKERLLLSNFEIKLIEVIAIADLTIEENNSLATKYQNNLVNDINIYKWVLYWQRNLPGGGLLLAYIGLFAQTILDACKLIERLPDNEKVMTLDEFKVNSNIENREALIKTLVIGFDVATILNKHKVFAEAKLWESELSKDIMEYALNIQKFTERIRL